MSVELRLERSLVSKCSSRISSAARFCFLCFAHLRHEVNRARWKEKPRRSGVVVITGSSRYRRCLPSCTRGFAAAGVGAAVSDRLIATAAAAGDAGKYRTSTTARQIARKMTSSIGAVWSSSPAWRESARRCEFIVDTSISFSFLAEGRVVASEADDRPSASLPVSGMQPRRCDGIRTGIAATLPTASRCCTLNLRLTGTAVKSSGPIRQADFTRGPDLFHLFSDLYRGSCPVRKVQVTRAPAWQGTAAGQVWLERLQRKARFVSFVSPAPAHVESIAKRSILAARNGVPGETMARLGGCPGHQAGVPSIVELAK